MPTIAIFAPELTGQAGLSLYLRVASSGVLTNSGGDALTEDPVSSGRFTATVDEAISVLHHAAVVSGSLTLRDGWLAASETLVVDSHPYDVPTVAEFEARTLATASYATSSAQTSLSSAISAIAAIFTGMTSLPNWLRRAFRKDAGTAGMGTAETEIQTGGTATFVGTTDNLEAIKDAGGGGGGSGDASQATLLEVQAAVGALAAADVLIQYPWNRYRKELRLTRGSAYKAAHGRAIQFQPTDRDGEVVENGWPDLTGWTIQIAAGQSDVRDLITGTGSVITPTGAQLVQCEFTSESLEKPTGTYYFELQATLGSDKIDLTRGKLFLEDGNAE